jgi:acyl carrier protein
VPAAFVGLPAIPLNTNGKADLTRLPEPADAISGGVPASTDSERRIAAIWQQALALDFVGVHDNFFELGGSSLTLVTVHSRLTDEFGRRPTMVTLYEYPTVATLARYLSGEESVADERADRLRAGRARAARQRAKR